MTWPVIYFCGQLGDGILNILKEILPALLFSNTEIYLKDRNLDNDI